MKRCDCAKPMTNAGGLCCRCGGSVYAGGAVGGAVNPVASLPHRSMQVEFDANGHIRLPMDNVTSQDLTLNIGFAEMPAQPGQVASCVAKEITKEEFEKALCITTGQEFRWHEIPKDSLVTLPEGVTVRQAVDGETILANLDAMDASHRDLILESIWRTYFSSTADTRIIASIEHLNESARAVVLEEIEKRFGQGPLRKEMHKMHDDLQRAICDIRDTINLGRIVI